MSDFGEVPFWVVASLGKSVALVNEFVGPCETYSVGSEGVLVSIQWDADGGLCAVVALDPQDDSYWENLPFSSIRPAGKLAYSLDINTGASGFSVPLQGADSGLIVF
jgi:hypothetical protein